MPFDHGLRPNNRQRIANAREKPIKANKNRAVDGAEGLFLRSGSPQNIYLLPQHPNFYLTRCPRPKQICDHPNNEPDKISHPARASPDSRSTLVRLSLRQGLPRQGRSAPDCAAAVLHPRPACAGRPPRLYLKDPVYSGPLLGLFEKTIWPSAVDGVAARVASQGPRIDVGARMREMWR